MRNTFFKYVTTVVQIKLLHIEEGIGNEDQITIIIVGTNKRG